MKRIVVLSLGIMILMMSPGYLCAKIVSWSGSPVCNGVAQLAQGQSGIYYIESPGVDLATLSVSNSSAISASILQKPGGHRGCR